MQAGIPVKAPEHILSLTGGTLQCFSSVCSSNVRDYFCRINKTLTLLQPSVNRECNFAGDSFTVNDLDFDFFFVLCLKHPQKGAPEE